MLELEVKQKVRAEELVRKKQEEALAAKAKMDKEKALVDAKVAAAKE